MKKLIIIILLVFLLINNLSAEPTDQQIRNAANILEVPYNDLKQFVQSFQNKNTSAADIIEIDAVTLHQAYQSNRLRADSLYNGKTLKITGVVYEVERDRVNLKGPGLIIGCVSVFFKTTEIPKILNLGKGQTVTFIGTGDIGSDYVEKVKDAVLVNY